MQTERLDARHPDSLARAVALLRRGEVIALPTDTVYGVGALAFRADAVAAIYRVKNRPPHKAIPVFIAAVEELSRVCRDVPSAVYPLLRRYWPGGLTVILPAASALPPVVTHGGPTVAVRIPNHPVVLDLLARLGEPLAVTSANLSGQPTPRTAQGVQAQLAGRLSLVLDDGPSPGDTPSTILDLTQSPPKILRAGAVTLSPRWLKEAGIKG